MSGVNRCTFVGNVGKADSRETSSGQSVLNFSLAVGEKWTDKQSGEKKERVEWIPCALFGKTAAALAQYITKGKQLYIEGKWQTRKWEKDGVTRYSTECIVQNVTLLGGGKGSSSGGHQEEDPGPSSGGGGSDEYSGSADDIPFARNESVSALDAIGERWNRANDRLI